METRRTAGTLRALLERATGIEWGRAENLGETNVASTLRDLLRRRNDEFLMADVRAAAPIVYDALSRVELDAALSAEHDPARLARDARSLESEIRGYQHELSWDDLGFPLSYARAARRFWPAADHRFLQRDERGEPRFVMPAPGFRKLIPGFEWAHVTDDVEDRLRTLGVADPDVRTTARGVFWDTGRTSISLPPEDAALLIDAASPLAAVAEKLAAGVTVPPGFAFVRRIDLEGRPTNAVVLPLQAALEMRGVTDLVRTKAEGVVGACRERLCARGIARPTVVELDIEGVRCVAVPTQEAGLLLSPAAHGDPAAALPVTRVMYDPDAVDYSPANALFMAEVSDLAYLEPAQVEGYMRAWLGLLGAGVKSEVALAASAASAESTTVRFIESKETDAQAIAAYDEDRNAIVIGFRGTSTWLDVLSNATFWLTDGSAYGGGDVHEGFATQLRSILSDLEVCIDEFRQRAKKHQRPPPTVMITGHSLGGALAVLFAGHLMRSQAALVALKAAPAARQTAPADARVAPTDAQAATATPATPHDMPAVPMDWCEGLRLHNLYTFGQPAVGDGAFREAFERDLAARGAVLFRFVNGQDIVPRMPPFLDHSPLEIRIDARGRIVPPKRDRDTAVSRQRAEGVSLSEDETSWGLSTSFDDHSLDHYLQLIRKGQDVCFSART